MVVLAAAESREIVLEHRVVVIQGEDSELSAIEYSLCYVSIVHAQVAMCLRRTMSRRQVYH